MEFSQRQLAELLYSFPRLLLSISKSLWLIENDPVVIFPKAEDKYLLIGSEFPE